MKVYLIPLLIFILTLQGGCMKTQKKEKYRENDMVTWKVNDELIIKGHLGQRRKHIVGEFDAEFYHPNSQRYMGQFPIDYMPEKFDQISKNEAMTIEKNNTGDPFEFDLMLNNSWIEPTDRSIHSSNALDHEDQVKVRINYLGLGLGLGLKSTKQDFEENQMQQLDKNSEHELYGMKCYHYLNQEKDELRKRCFAHSKNPLISGYSVITFPKEVIVDYQEFAYGGVKIRYIVSPKNLEKIPQIDQAIWRLIDTWNVAPN